MSRLDDPELDRLGDALHASISEDLAHQRQRHRRRALRGGTAASVVALAGAAVGVYVAIRPAAGESPWAKRTLQRAAAVVVPTGADDQILHISATETYSPGARRESRRLNGTTIFTVREQAWIREGKHPLERAVLQTPGGPVLEEYFHQQIYNRTGNTLYAAPSIPRGKPRYTIVPTHGNDSPGTYRLTARSPKGKTVTQTISNSDVRALRAGRDAAAWIVSWDASTQHQSLRVIIEPKSLVDQRPQPDPSLPNPASTDFAAELHGLLNAGDAQVHSATTSDGQKAIKITQPEADSSRTFRAYYVKPGSYTPIELDTYIAGNQADGIRVRFHTYTRIPLAGHNQLLHVHVPASARTIHKPRDWWNASDLPRPF